MKAYTFSFILLVVLCVFNFLLVPERAHAELADLVGAHGTDISVSVTPDAPGPLQNVTIELTSFAVDLNRAKINWTLDGKLQPSGTGVKKFSFRSGTIGSKSTVTIEIIIDANTTVNKTVIVQPAGLDLLWESPDSYVPPFYEGKALPASEATIKVVALPNASATSGATAGNLVYQWKRNYTLSQANSGYGKNVFSFKNDYLNSDNKEAISVQASSGDGTGAYTAQASLEIVPRPPKIIFYQLKPLEGEDFANALLDNFTIKDKEVTIVAEPYFFSPAPVTGKQYTYAWSINGNDTTAPTPENILTVRPQEGTQGTGRIDVSIENTFKLFQSATKSLLLNF